ncbi:hypothetical protein CS022_23270 [Veronia nyctiphanis]|uniref:Uncharacterized protein n=1 Tax=Veronia nyctiphanis TaxID=1278244 RepID=A0A4Q0YID3_9GAMM|nr:hypothetical protein [Veronia nyctiphanis]RXJ70460.1 hypothetical protein CS022_23270 [Veronia nyctiphanis]
MIPMSCLASVPRKNGISKINPINTQVDKKQKEVTWELQFLYPTSNFDKLELDFNLNKVLEKNYTLPIEVYIKDQDGYAIIPPLCQRSKSEAWPLKHYLPQFGCDVDLPEGVTSISICLCIKGHFKLSDSLDIGILARYNESFMVSFSNDKNSDRNVTLFDKKDRIRQKYT